MRHKKYHNLCKRSKNDYLRKIERNGNFLVSAREPNLSCQEIDGRAQGSSSKIHPLIRNNSVSSNNESAELMDADASDVETESVNQSMGRNVNQNANYNAAPENMNYLGNFHDAAMNSSDGESTADTVHEEHQDGGPIVREELMVDLPLLSRNNIARNDLNVNTAAGGNVDENEYGHDVVHEIHDSSDSDEEINGAASDGNETDEEHHERHQNERQEQQDEPLEDPPLYAGAQITVRESMLLILTLFLAFNLSQTCLEAIIQCINLHCINNELRKNSLYKFKKYFNIPEMGKFKKHYYCLHCVHELEDVNSVCPACKSRQGVSYFVEMPFLDQLKEMYKRRGFYGHLQHRLQRNVLPNTINDIYDGILYNQLIDSGFLKNPHNISISWYTDGIPVYKSSKISMWPLYLSINELPYRLRTQRENLLLAGLWFGNKKIAGNSFLTKLSSQFDTLAAGIDMTLPEGKVIPVQGVLLFGTCDLPAKSELMNLTQFNGEYGCPKCEQPGETLPLPSGGNTHIYTWSDQIIMRTTAQSIEYANQVDRPTKPVKGWKGPSEISRLMVDFIPGIGIDRMHGVDGGVIKKLLSLWFDSKFSSHPYSLIDVKNMIDEKLKKLKPPKFVHRLPRSIDDIVHWKASEFKMWAFYYSVPILHGIMRADFFDNYLQLVIAVSILSADTITPEMVEIAEKLIEKYLRDFERLYGLQFCTINPHQLRHLADCVKQMGPLWCYLCYTYEDLNGRFLQDIHGTRHIDSQIATRHTQFIAMAQHLDQLPEGPIKNFCQKRKKQVKIQERLYAGCYSVGTYSSKIFQELPGPVVEAMHRSQVPVGTVEIYKRLLKDKQLFISEIYSRDTKTQSSHVNYLHNDEELIGSIHSFIKVTPECQCMVECDCWPLHYAIIKKLRYRTVFGTNLPNYGYIPLPHILKIRREHEIHVVPITMILSVCVHMEIDDEEYIGLPINSQELE